MGWNCGHKGNHVANRRALRTSLYEHTISLLNLDIQCLGLGVAGRILNRQGIGGVFFGRDRHAAVVRGPNRVVLRLELHGLGVGHAITELHCLAAVDNSWTGVESLDGQFLPAKLIDGLTVRVKLLLRSLFQRAALELAIFLPAREEDPQHVQQDGQEGQRRVQDGVL
jgi:hypothetical protein